MHGFRTFELKLVPAVLLIAGLLFPGCAKVGPDYTPPQQATPKEWVQATEEILPVRGDLTDWWRVYNDPVLDQLIILAREGNKNLAIAVERVQEARAQVGVVTGNLYPEIDAQGQATRSRTSENTEPPGGITTNLFSAGFSADWEIDLFGRVRRAIESAEASLLATVDDRNDVMISLYAEVARAYFLVRSLQARISSSEDNIESQKSVLALTQVRFKWGLATDLDVSQARRVLAQTEADLPVFRADLAQTVATLGVLIGQSTASVYPLILPPKPIPLPPSQVAIGLPAEILRNRPDIRSAERTIAARTAQIGVATAELYPIFTLSGNIGLSAADTSDFAQRGSMFFGFGPSFQWNLFSGGRIRSQILLEDARTKQALLSYEQTVLNALGEVEANIALFVQSRERVASLEDAVAASRRSLDLSLSLYKEGLIDFQPVLDSQRDLFLTEVALSASRGETATSLALLYLAVGGGWNPDQSEPLAVPPGLLDIYFPSSNATSAANPE